jgi:hypothetical protein
MITVIISREFWLVLSMMDNVDDLALLLIYTVPSPPASNSYIHE